VGHLLYDTIRGSCYLSDWEAFLLIEGKDFLEFVWSRQPRGYACLVFKPKADEWLEYYIRTPIDWDRIKALPDYGDLYFCPNIFTAKARRKDLVLPSRVMYQDLDEATPIECPLFPTLWWETSPGRYQAIWVLDVMMEPIDFAAYNRAMNRACNADPGTWDLTRLLRVPGSHNNKRDCLVSAAQDEVPVLADAF
jgi:hypothetical protein